MKETFVLSILLHHLSFAEYHLFYRALLQKRPIILRSLLIVATPYMESDVHMKETCVLSVLCINERDP